MVKQIPRDKKATVAEIITFYFYEEHKCISEGASVQALRRMSYHMRFHSCQEKKSVSTLQSKQNIIMSVPSVFKVQVTVELWHTVCFIQLGKSYIICKIHHVIIIQLILCWCLDLKLLYFKQYLQTTTLINIIKGHLH